MAGSIREEPEAISDNKSMKSKLRNPLRSTTKSKEEKPPVVDPSNSSASRRRRSSSTVSKSFSVLDITAKEKSAKPPSGISIPGKLTVNSAAKSVGTITPISETTVKRANTRRKSETPHSDISVASSRKKFNVLSSSSYWLNQIKLSESAAKHSISLGFFKLALEAGCEPQKMRDGLKSYARRHNLSELGETVKDLFDCYNISETLEQLQLSETCAQVPEEGTRSSDDEVHSSSSTMGTRKLKPKSLNTDSTQVPSVTASVKEEVSPKNNPAPPRTRASLNKNSANSKSVSDIGKPKIQRKSQKQTKQETDKDKDRTTQEKKSTGVEGNPPASDTIEENKENMDSSMMEEIGV